MFFQMVLINFFKIFETENWQRFLSLCEQVNMIFSSLMTWDQPASEANTPASLAGGILMQ